MTDQRIAKINQRKAALQEAINTSIADFNEQCNVGTTLTITNNQLQIEIEK